MNSLDGRIVLKYRDQKYQQAVFMFQNIVILRSNAIWH